MQRKRFLGLGKLFALTAAAILFWGCSDDNGETPPDSGGKDTIADLTADLPGPDLAVDQTIEPDAPSDTEDHPDWTVGLLMRRPEAYEGYSLFTPGCGDQTFLIDMRGQLVHSWQHTTSPGNSVYLLEDGTLVRAMKLGNQAFAGASIGGGVQRIQWDGTVIWEYMYNDDKVVQHHDIEPLPNGNVLMVAWEKKTKQEAVAAGRNPNLTPPEVWAVHLIEVKPDGATGGTIVWEWHIWDHLVQELDPTKANYGVVADHPELMNINYKAKRKDWLHTNAVDYNADLDQILLSPRAASEVIIIDHSTTTAEAAGHVGGKSGKGGDFLYRWGNPLVYGAGTAADQQVFGQHDGRWVPKGLPGAGNLMMFSNGPFSDGDYSAVQEIAPPLDTATGLYTLTAGQAYGPASTTWTYTAQPKTDFFASNQSGAHRLPNGNTLICSGPQGLFFEVTPQNKIVWKYVNPVGDAGPVKQGTPPPHKCHQVFRVTRYAADYPGLKGKDLSPKGYIELPK